jgi:hypothetical protein
MADKKKITEFCKYVVKELGIDNPPTIALLTKRDGLKTTASYDYSKENKVCKVFEGNRMTVDVMRSIAHELVHHKQWEDGRLKVKPPDIGGPIEDEANAQAGQFIKKFAKKDPSIYDD